MRAFVQLRRMIAFNEDLPKRINELESHIERHDEEIDAIFQAIKQMLSPPEPVQKKIGFTAKEKQSKYSGRR